MGRAVGRVGGDVHDLDVVVAEQGAVVFVDGGAGVEREAQPAVRSAIPTRAAHRSGCMAARYTVATTYAKPTLTLPRALRIFVTLPTRRPEQRKEWSV